MNELRFLCLIDFCRGWDWFKVRFKSLKHLCVKPKQVEALTSQAYHHSIMLWEGNGLTDEVWSVNSSKRADNSIIDKPCKCKSSNTRKTLASYLQSLNKLFSRRFQKLFSFRISASASTSENKLISDRNWVFIALSWSTDSYKLKLLLQIQYF